MLKKNIKKKKTKVVWNDIKVFFLCFFHFIMSFKFKMARA